MPPALYRLTQDRLPFGTMLQTTGVFDVASATWAQVTSQPISLAMAGRCSRALSEPPMEASSATALSKAACVMMSLTLMPLRTISTTAAPVWRARKRRWAVGAGCRAPPGTIMPRPSDRQPMVLAVPRNGQMPGPV